jgi:amino acid permease
MGSKSPKNRQPENNLPLNNLPQDVAISIQTAQIRSSIIPPAEELEKLEKFFPGITKSLIESYTGQVEHRMTLEKTVIFGDDKRATKAQLLSFIIIMTSIVGGIILILLNKDAMGLTAIIGALTSLVGAFFGSAILRKKEREDKRK